MYIEHGVWSGNGDLSDIPSISGLRVEEVNYWHDERIDDGEDDVGLVADTLERDGGYHHDHELYKSASHSNTSTSQQKGTHIESPVRGST